MGHFMCDFHVGASVDDFDRLVRDPRIWPTFWVGMDNLRLLAETSAVTAAA